MLMLPLYDTEPEIQDIAPGFTYVILYRRVLIISIETFDKIQKYRRKRIDTKDYLKYTLDVNENIKLCEDRTADRYAIAGIQLVRGGAVTTIELVLACDAPGRRPMDNQPSQS